ncbi:MAG: hypothetical protein ACE5KZ_06145 [Candidatus Scalinduaceae bacterium]
MDTIQRLMKEIKADREVQNCRYFTSNFLNNVADVFEKHGFGVTKVFLIEKKVRRELKWQATALLSVLNILDGSEEVKQKRSIGRCIIKALETIKSKEV